MQRRAGGSAANSQGDATARSNRSSAASIVARAGAGLVERLGLVPALRYLFEGLAQRSQLQISIDAVPEQRLPRRVETTLYHVAKEALHNVIKHARATAVRVTFQRKAGSISCLIRDNGVGFDPASISARPGEQGFGLIGMRERLRVVGGEMQINSLRESGRRAGAELSW